MLGYIEGQVLEFFNNTLLRRYYYLVFGIQILRGAVERAKRAITKGKSDKQLAGQTTTPYMSLKTFPSGKCKSLKFDKYILLDKKLTGSKKAWTKWRQDLKGDKIIKTDLESLMFIEADVTESIPAMIVVMTEVE